MTKKQKEMLAVYKKANKEARVKLLDKYGFISETKFYEFLEVESVVKTKETKKKKEENTPVDVVIAFDTTGSMSSYIQSVRDHAKETVKELFKNSPNLKMKIVAFGDYCDMKSKDNFGRAYQESELTSDVNNLVDFIDTAENTSGGDNDEFYELVIKKITEETPWRGGKRSVLFIADCDPHEVGYTYIDRVQDNQIDWKEEAKKAAKFGIQFDTLQIHACAKWYKELSEITGGVNMNFKNANKISDIVVGTTYARTSKEAFTTAYTSAMTSGDSELIGAYKRMSTLVED